MVEAFNGRSTFNEDISGWDVSSVISMTRLFYNCSSFNQDIGDWNTSSVVSMSGMFQEPIHLTMILEIGILHLSLGWITCLRQMIFLIRTLADGIHQKSNTCMGCSGTHLHSIKALVIGTLAMLQILETFVYAISFNQDISDWNVSSATDMTDMFQNTPALSNTNKGLIHESFASNSNWSYDWREFVVLDNSNFQTAVNLWFDNQAEANATYGHISDWNTSAVTNMTKAFQGRSSFNHDIGSWDISNVTNTLRSCLMVPQHSINQLGIGMYHQSQMLHGCLMELHHLTKIFKIGILPTWSIWMECLKVLPLSINQLEVGMLVMLAL